jgi:hypothetical protein
MWAQTEQRAAAPPRRIELAEKKEKRKTEEKIEAIEARPEGPVRSQKRYPGFQLGGVVCVMPHWSWIPERPPKRGGERRGQEGPPEEAIGPEGQSRRNEEGVALSPGH